MPVFHITSPDGRKFKVTGPPGSTREDALARVQAYDEERPAIPIAPDPYAELAAEQGPLDSFLIGAGRQATELMRGAGELFGKEVQRDPVEERAYQALQEERPLATAIGESLPFVAGGVAAGAGMRGAGLGANLLRQAEVAGAIGATMPGDLEQRLTNLAVEGLTGAAGEGIGRGISSLAGLGIERAAPHIARNVQRARDLGYRIMPTTELESRGLRNVVEGGLEATPGGALELDVVKAHNAALLNRAAAEAIGEQADMVNDEVLDQAFVRIGGEFDRIMSPDVRVSVTDELLDDLLRIDEEAIRPHITGPADPVRTAVDRSLDFIDRFMDGPGIPADQLQTQISEIGRYAKARMRTQPELGIALYDMQRALLDAARDAMSQSDRSALDTARRQYRNLMTLTHGQNVNPVTGDVYPGRVASTLQRLDRRGFMRGRNRSPFYEGVRFMARQQPALQTSGTAERTAMREIMKAGLVGTGIFGAGTGDPETAAQGGIAAIMAGIAAPNLMTRAYLSPLAAQWMARSASPGAQAINRAIGLGMAQTID